MPTLTELNRESSWVEHMIRVKARSTGRWLSKRTGVESLFSDRKGALDAISRDDCAASLFLRDLPDMALRSKATMAIVEAKWISPTYDNVSVELTQLLYFRFCKAFGTPINYIFGRADARGWLEAFVLPVAFFKPRVIRLTGRSGELHLGKLSHSEFPSVPIEPWIPEGGSGDPYALMSKEQVVKACPIDAWLATNAGDYFKLSEMISWEGRDDANRDWIPVPLHKWRVNEKPHSYYGAKIDHQNPEARLRWFETSGSGDVGYPRNQQEP